MIEQTKWEICCHESAHAVLNHRLRAAYIIAIHVSGNTCGWVDIARFGHKKNTAPRIKHENDIIASLAGQLAKEKASFFNWTMAGRRPPQNIAPLVAHDRAKTITAIIKETNETETDPAFQNRIAEKLFPETAGPYLYWLARRSSVLVEKYWKDIVAVASRLFWQNQLSRKEFLSIIKKTRETKCDQ